MPISTYTDWLVGAVSFATGVAALWGALSMNPRVWELRKLRWLVGTIGAGPARVFVILLGVALMGLGVAVALGWKIHWESDQPTITAQAIAKHWP